jgi:hypothetical protein
MGLVVKPGGSSSLPPLFLQVGVTRSIQVPVKSGGSLFFFFLITLDTGPREA